MEESNLVILSVMALAVSIVVGTCCIYSCWHHCAKR